ncbi:MAG: metallophosphoesterase [bacterium]|nr:metallophosphoesterase [bacterium]
MDTRIHTTNNTAFKAGYLNVLATADNHGKIMELPKVIKSIENNAGSIFPKAGNKSTLNLFSIVGDWFINPSKQGFITNPALTNGDMQKWALLRTIDNIKAIVQKQAQNSKFNFATVYAMGNHCLDAGTDFVLNVMKTCPIKSLITNVNIDKSDKVKKAMADSDNIVKSVVYEIPDDKKSDLIHKVMVLGITIPSMGYYNPGLCKGLEFYDDSDQKDTTLTEEKLQGTINSVREQVEAFKKENPKGAVILMSHMGESLAEIIIKNVPDIDHVLNGHDHKTTQKTIGKTTISSLGKDNEIIKALNCKFDNDGNFSVPSLTQYDINRTLLDGIDEHPFQIALKARFANDTKPLIEINDGFKLAYGDEIRYQNSYLMNFLTSAIKEEIVKNIDSDVYTVGLLSSIVRCGIENGADNLTIMKIFDGISKELAGLESGYVKGEDLTGLIVENVIDNLANKSRNTLLHWSDVQVNRSLIKDIQNGNSNAQYYEAIRVRNPKTQDFEPIDMSKDYKIAIGSKYLLKNSIKYPPKIRNNFSKINVTYDEMFRKYLENNNYKLTITENTKEKRIL